MCNDVLYPILAESSHVGGFKQACEVSKYLRTFFLKTLDMSVD